MSGEEIRGLRKLLKGKSWDLYNHIVDGGLKARRGLPRNVIGYFIKGVTHRQFGRYLGNGKSRCLTGQGRTPGNPRVHLDDHQSTILWVHGKLNIGSAGIHPNLANDLECGIPHDLILFVSQGLGRSYGDGISRVNPHGVEVFNGAHDDHVVLVVTHDLQLELFPPQDGFLNQDLVHRRKFQAPSNRLGKILWPIGNVSTAPPEGPRRSNDQWEVEFLLNPKGLV